MQYAVGSRDKSKGGGVDLTMPPRASALADQAYAVIRDAILSHQLPPGTRLSVPDLARRLGISRSPAREAITRIAHEGLATVEPHRGAVVADIRSEDLVEIYALREVLEGLACRLAATQLDDEDVAELRQLLDEHEQAVAAGDTERHYDLDQQFHAAIRDLAGNSRLIESLDRLQGQIRVAMYTTRRSPGGMPQALAEHRVILDALSTRDPARAETAARQHIARLLHELEQTTDGADHRHRDPTRGTTSS